MWSSSVSRKVCAEGSGPLAESDGAAGADHHGTLPVGECLGDGLCVKCLDLEGGGGQSVEEGRDLLPTGDGIAVPDEASLLGVHRVDVRASLLHCRVEQTTELLRRFAHNSIRLRCRHLASPETTPLLFTCTYYSHLLMQRIGHTSLHSVLVIQSETNLLAPLRSKQVHSYLISYEYRSFFGSQLQESSGS